MDGWMVGWLVGLDIFAAFVVGTFNMTRALAEWFLKCDLGEISSSFFYVGYLWEIIMERQTL